MNELQAFRYDSKEVRTLEMEGEPWFVAKDICEILSLGDTSKAIQGLADSEKGTTSVPTLGGLQSMTIVSESGMYALIFKSRKAEAKSFRLWVTGTVLPAIRKHGSYLPSSKTVYGILRGLVDDLERQDQAIAATNARIDKVVQGIPALPVPENAQDEYVTPTQLGKMFHVRESGQRVNQLLQQAGLQFRIGGEWIPNDKGKRYATTIPVQLESGKCVYQLHWQRRVFDMICEATA